MGHPGQWCAMHREKQIPFGFAQGRLSLGLPRGQLHCPRGPKLADAQDDTAAGWLECCAEEGWATQWAPA
jgi:hypothetical protein